MYQLRFPNVQLFSCFLFVVIIIILAKLARKCLFVVSFLFHGFSFSLYITLLCGSSCPGEWSSPPSSGLRGQPQSRLSLRLGELVRSVSSRTALRVPDRTGRRGTRTGPGRNSCTTHAALSFWRTCGTPTLSLRWLPASAGCPTSSQSQ